MDVVLLLVGPNLNNDLSKRTLRYLATAALGTNFEGLETTHLSRGGRAISVLGIVSAMLLCGWLGWWTRE